MHILRFYGVYHEDRTACSSVLGVVLGILGGGMGMVDSQSHPACSAKRHWGKIKIAGKRLSSGVTCS